jgi:ATP-dependent protease ClpP protease subunit
MLHLTGSVNKKMLHQVIEYLEYNNLEEVGIRITSHGGDSEIALAIVGLLKSQPKPVITEVYGFCYSAATLIFAVGQQRRMQKYAWCMVHEGSEAVEGNASTVKHAAKHMERCETHWNTIMAELTGTDAKVWEKLNEKDSYLNAEECLKLNLATEII